MPPRPRRPGEFCWINILTPDPPGAREFFAALLGWGYGDIPGMGHLIQVGGRNVGGLFDLHGPGTPPGLPPGIGVMVLASDADTIVRRARELGGSAGEPFDIAGNGRMAELVDPTGGKLDIWEPGRMPGTDVDAGVHGAPSWFEEITSDVERARRFYEQLFGWTSETMPMPVPGGAYTTFKLGEGWVGGMMGKSPEMGSMPSHWGTYFTVTDVDATAAEAERLGGRLFFPLRDIERVGRMCGITSPQGVMFYAITYAPPAG